MKGGNRRYKRIERKIIELKEKGVISTMSPKNMTPEDVREFILYSKERLSPSDVVHEINAMKKLLIHLDNNAVDVCLNHYPGLKPTVRGVKRKPSMPDEMYEKILARSKELDPTDYKLIRAYAFVLLCINTGTRNKEIRYATVCDLDIRSWIFDTIHV